MKDRYAIEAQHKKSVIEYNYFRKKFDDDTYYYATMETCWRWGKFYLSLDAEEVKEITDSNSVDLDEYDDFELDYCDDGCSCDWSFSDNTPESVREDIIELWAEDGYSALEENDWEDYDCEYTIINGVILTKVTEDE